MQLNDKVQHVYLVGAKSLGAYGGYETFVYKPIIIYTLEAFQQHPSIDEIYVSCLEGWSAVLEAYCKICESLWGRQKARYKGNEPIYG